MAGARGQWRRRWVECNRATPARTHRHWFQAQTDLCAPRISTPRHSMSATVSTARQTSHCASVIAPPQVCFHPSPHLQIHASVLTALLAFDPQTPSTRVLPTLPRFSLAPKAKNAGARGRVGKCGVDFRRYDRSLSFDPVYAYTHSPCHHAFASRHYKRHHKAFWHILLPSPAIPPLKFTGDPTQYTSQVIMQLAGINCG
ncbi:hypothetical protein B0H16DRAFT_1574167 [Mycena metata]|uniref:Uncharacterized protein n=1 Tax=Mycena metata TaxID=1033252 RepID=A0AAD7I8B6_9AGAR|nr:hypothetical protein B0H16DRAFT_1574167 [Mycena metata]